MDDPTQTPHRWSDISLDPMDPRVLRRRRALVDAARSDSVPDRTAYLQELARGRRVLDIGVVDHTSGTERSEQWLHGNLVQVAGEILGIDVIENEVELLRQRGFTVECMDLTAGERPEGLWEVVVAGELIEHLGNPGGLFAAAADLLTDDGIFVLTTPNPYALGRVVQNLRGRPEENVDHALLLSAWGIAELAERAGLRLRSVRPIATEPHGWKARATAAAVRHRLLPFVPESCCESILYEVVRP